MAIYPFLDKPGFVVNNHHTNTLDLSTYVIRTAGLSDLSIGLHHNNGNDRVIPILGYKNKTPFFGLIIDSDSPNYQFVKATTNAPGFLGELQEYDLTHFLATLDSYVDFQGTKLSELGTWTTRIKSEDGTTEVYLNIDSNHDGTFACALYTGRAGETDSSRVPSAIRYNTTSIPETLTLESDIDSLNFRLNRLESTTSSRYVSR